MGFRKPISTLGGTTFWDNIRQNEYFILQKHKVGIPVWPYEFRILMRENRMEIANSNDYSEIDYDWNYLEKHAIPQLDKKIDWLNTIDIVDIITKIILNKISL